MISSLSEGMLMMIIIIIIIFFGICKLSITFSVMNEIPQKR